MRRNSLRSLRPTWDWRKQTLHLLLSAVLLFATAYGVWIYLEYRENERLLLGGYDLDARVEEFEREPNAYLCFLLTDRFTSLKEHAKAIHYAERCINDFNSDSSAAGWLLRLNMASNLAKLGRKQEAIVHLRKSLELDTENRMKAAPFIENSGLGELELQLKEQEGASNKRRAQ